MEDRMNNDIGGIVDNINEMNRLIDFDEQFNILMDVYSLYPETPKEWFGILIKMAQRVTESLKLYGFEKDDIVYDQVKEKFKNDLRVYFSIPRFYDDDISGVMYDRLNMLSNDINVIIMDAEEEVKKLSLTSSIY